LGCERLLDGEEELCDAPALKLDLVLIDLVMPGTDAMATVQALRKLHADNRATAVLAALRHKIVCLE
jgi:DNA-binding NarL/FixJ family response regulator